MEAFRELEGGKWWIGEQAHRRVLSYMRVVLDVQWNVFK